MKDGKWAIGRRGDSMRGREGDWERGRKNAEAQRRGGKAATGQFVNWATTGAKNGSGKAKANDQK